MNGLLYQKIIDGCHQCPNANEPTKNGKNMSCTKDCYNRLVGKYIKEERYPDWCSLIENMKKQEENLLQTMKTNWRSQS